MSFDLAQVNIARLVADLDSPQLKDFVDALDPINAEADLADGFRWRMQTEDGNATSIAGFSSDQKDGVGVIVNMSTWRDVESLAAFVFGPMHVAIMRRRREWFLSMRESYMACWWVPAGHRPSVSEAEESSPSASRVRRRPPSPSSITTQLLMTRKHRRPSSAATGCAESDLTHPRGPEMRVPADGSLCGDVLAIRRC